jgi:hypothetical protein
VLEARKTARRIPNLALAAAFVIATPLLWWFQATLTAEACAKETERLTNETAALQSETNNIDQAQKRQKALEVEVAPFLISAAERSVWAQILNELSAKIPNRFIWVTSLEPIETEESPAATTPTAPRPGQKNPPPTSQQIPKKAITHLEVKGLYLDNPPNDKGAALVDEFYTGLFGSTVFNISESTDRASVITERTTPTGETWAYRFTMRLPLKKGIPLL